MGGGHGALPWHRLPHQTHHCYFENNFLPLGVYAILSPIKVLGHLTDTMPNWHTTVLYILGISDTAICIGAEKIPRSLSDRTRTTRLLTFWQTNLAQTFSGKTSMFCDILVCSLLDFPNKCTSPSIFDLAKLKIWYLNLMHYATHNLVQRQMSLSHISFSLTKPHHKWAFLMETQARIF